MAGRSVAVNFIDNPHAPEIHATGHGGLWMHEGNLHITFTAGRYDHGFNPGAISNVVNARVVIPLEQAKYLADSITKYLSNPGTPPELPASGPLH